MELNFHGSVSVNNYLLSLLLLYDYNTALSNCLFCFIAKHLGKKPPDDLFGPDEPEQLPCPVPVHTLDAMQISSPKKPVTQPLGEDVSMNTVPKQEPSSKNYYCV